MFIPGETRKTGALLCGICLNGLDFLLFSFPSCSCEIRLLQIVCVLVLPDATFNSNTGCVLKKSQSKIAVFKGLILQKNTRCLKRSFSSYREFYYRIKEENAILEKKTGKIRTFLRGPLHHECITLLNASKYCTLDNPTGP